MNHDEVRELLGAYCVDAVDETERRAVEHHLDGCGDCRAEAGLLLEAAAALASQPATPPPQVWEGVRAAVREEGGRPVTPLRRRPRLGVRLAALGTAAAVAALVVLTVRAMSDQRDLEDRIATLERDPGVDHVVLRSADDTVTADVVLLGDGTGYLVRHDLDPLPAGRVYQLWALTGEAAASAGVLGPDPGTARFRARPPVDGFAVSVEPAGGSSRPTTDPLVVGFLD